MTKNWLILIALMTSVIHSANADSIADNINTIHRTGLEMHQHVDDCLAEIKVYQDVEHKECKLFNQAADLYMAARDRVLNYAFGKGIVKKEATPLEHMAAIAIIAEDAGLEPPYGVIAGWQAMDRYLDQSEMMNQ